jgi:hypothetical protein
MTVLEYIYKHTLEKSLAINVNGTQIAMGKPAGSPKSELRRKLNSSL